MATVAVEKQASPQLFRFSLDTYRKLTEAGILGPEDRVELIEGTITAMSPIGTRHVRVMTLLDRWFHRAIGDVGAIVVQNPVVLDDESVPRPDIMLLRDVPTRERLPNPSDVILLIEVSDTTLVYDRDFKVPLYARFSIPEVWIIDLEHDVILRFTEPAEDGYRRTERVRRADQLVVEPLSDVTITLNLDELFS